MARQLIEKPSEILEKITEDCLDLVGVKLKGEKIKLLIRLLISGIANHYFQNPDDLINMGFLSFQKSPDKTELFRVNLIKDADAGVVNAETVWRYYNGSLGREQQFRQILNSFLENLINYSQEQEIEITKSISQLEKRKEKGG